MKRFSSVISTIIIAATSTLFAAVPDEFTVKAPDWAEAAFTESTRATSRRVHKSPAATSPYCVYKNGAYTGEGILNDVAYWGTAANKTIRECRFGGITPVVRKANGWVELYEAGPKGADGWVKASEVQLFPKINLSEDAMKGIPYVNFFYGMIVFMDYNPQEETATVHIGKIDNGIAVLPYSVPVTFNRVQGTAPSLSETDDFYVLNLTNKECLADGTPAISLFSSDFIAELLDRAEASERPLALMGTGKTIVTALLKAQ